MNIAVATHDDGLGMTKDGSNLEASGAFNVHEIAVGRLDETLQFVRPGFHFGRGGEEIVRHVCCCVGGCVGVYVCDAIEAVE